MSVDSIIRKAGHTCNINSMSTATTSGGQLLKTWVARHSSIPCRLNALRPEDEDLAYDREKVNPRFAMYIRITDAIASDPPSTRDRVSFDSRDFDIRKIDNWDEQDNYYRIVLEEITDD
ncbi:MAG: hypothetical protein GTO16_13825 [Candidatus Aminicenantes bacterium]|nr:hypothetical protein [Candidatus Aminicenantes bacterium]